ncbi:MAG: cell division protein FtsZ [Marinifilaceae bacterium]|jgi:cell division protein FtsZ|nr:cell division protein FtsZ [Marinifilaceae bacterium]
MSEELIDFELKQTESSIIKVIGVGGGGGNAVNYMFQQGIKDVDFVICNTDAQALENSMIPTKIQLGESLTEGRGAGNKPERGEQSAIENLDDVIEVLSDNTKMVFITAGMGGGTGTGAAPIIAKAAKEMGILTVGIVTIPFKFEGLQRFSQAIEGTNKLKENVDSLLVINNEKLSQIYGDLKLSTAFSKADDVLATAAKGIAEIITLHGYINVDFEDVKTVMTDSGVAVMGSAVSEGSDRAINAIQEALTSPLLNSNDVKGARDILLNITSGSEEVTMDEVGQITTYVQQAVGDSASIIWGTGQDESIGDKVSVTIIATGFGDSDINLDLASTHPQNNINITRRSNQENKFESAQTKRSDWTGLNNNEISEIENTPAYLRKNNTNNNQSNNRYNSRNYKTGNVVKFNLEDD